MRARFLNQPGLVAMLALALVCIGLENALAGSPQKGEKIEFSEPQTDSPVVVSNLNRLNANQSTTFKQVKEDLLRPFGGLDPKNAFQMPLEAPAPQFQRPTQAPLSRRAQEMLDKRKNWAFTSYEELFLPSTVEEAAGIKETFGIKQYGLDGREKKGQTVMDKYYESLDQKAGRGTNQTPADMESARAAFINQNGFDPLGKPVTGSNSFMATFRPDDPDTLADKGNVIFGLTGAPNTIGTLEEIRSKQSHLDEIRKSILGDAAIHVPRPGEEGSVLLSTDDYYSRAAKTPGDKLMSQQLSEANEVKTKAVNPWIVADPTANALHSHINDDLTARALGLPNPVGARTNAVVEKPVTAQSVTAEWDPFGANRPKPKF